MVSHCQNGCAKATHAPKQPLGQSNVFANQHVRPPNSRAKPSPGLNELVSPSSWQPHQGGGCIGLAWLHRAEMPGLVALVCAKPERLGHRRLGHHQAVADAQV